MRDTSNTNTFDCIMFMRLSSPSDRFETVNTPDGATTPYYGNITDETRTTLDSFETVNKSEAATTPYYGNITDETRTTLDSDIITDETGKYIILLVVCIVMLLITLALVTLWLRRRNKGKYQL